MLHFSGKHSTTEVQQFNHSTIQPFNHSTIHPFNHSTIQPFNHSTIQPYLPGAMFMSFFALLPSPGKKIELSQIGETLGPLHVFKSTWIDVAPPDTDSCDTVQISKSFRVSTNYIPYVKIGIHEESWFSPMEMVKKRESSMLFLTSC